jgi:YcxB-like protein
MDKEIVINYKLDIDVLMKISKYVVMKMRFVKYLPLYFIVIILFNYLPNLLNVKPTINKEVELNDYLYFAPFIALIWFFIYYKTVSTMKKSIQNNRRNFENQKMILNQNSYIQEGETFKVESFWNEIFQIKETKSWFLIYPNKNSATPILKSDLKDNQYNELKALFNSLNIKKSLK